MNSKNFRGKKFERKKVRLFRRFELFSARTFLLDSLKSTLKRFCEISWNLFWNFTSIQKFLGPKILLVPKFSNKKCFWTSIFFYQPNLFRSNYYIEQKFVWTQYFYFHLFFMIEPEHKNKNSTIIMGFDSIEIYIINKFIKLKIPFFLSNFVKPYQSPTYLPRVGHNLHNIKNNFSP